MTPPRRHGTRAAVITRLSLTDFRSYADAVIAPGPGFVVLTGENGAGKTNVLEAVSLLAPGRGLRGSTLGELARRGGAGGFGVAARLGDVELGTGSIAAAPERRTVRINGAPASAAALGDWLSLVWVTPAQDRLFGATAGERRRFLDRLVLALDPGHARAATRYEAAMRQRNRLLVEARPDAEWLRGLETAMVEHGTAVAGARAALVDALAARIAGQPESVLARAGLALGGWQPTSGFAHELATGRARDAAAGRTLAGPHRQDLVVTHLGKRQPAANSSTGEQKALLLGLVLAHADLVAERQRRPVLLLDEITAHLDAARRAALFERLEASGGQVWMTGTDKHLFAGIGEATWLNITEGAVTPG